MARKRPKQGTSKTAAEHRKKLFVEAYIANGGNATDAAKAAGYSERTARSQGARLLTDVDIRGRVAVRAEETAKKYELTADLAARSIYQEITFDPAKLYREDGTLKDVTELDEDTRMALVSVEFEHVGDKDSPATVRKIKWASRHQAREHLMKHLGMFEADNKQRGGALSDLPRELVQQIVERLKYLNNGSR